MEVLKAQRGSLSWYEECSYQCHIKFWFRKDQRPGQLGMDGWLFCGLPWPPHPFCDKAIDIFSRRYVKCYAKASSSLLALILPPRWRPKPCLHGNSEPQSPWIGSSQDPQEAGAPGLLVPRESRPARPGARSGGIPAHLVIPAGESPPPGPVTPGR